MSRRADWQLLERMDAITAGDLSRAVHAAGHDFALGAGVRYTADMTDCNDFDSIYRVRAWFGENLIFDSEPGMCISYMRINWAAFKDDASREWLWDAEWQRTCDELLPPEDVPDSGDQLDAAVGTGKEAV